MNIRRDPREDTVADDVVELALPLDRFADVRCGQFDVGDPVFRKRLASQLDLAPRRVDAHELASGKRVGHRQKVHTGRAADFEHASTLDRGGSHAEEAADGRQVLGVAADDESALVGHLVITGVGGSRDHQRPF